MTSRLLGHLTGWTGSSSGMQDQFLSLIDSFRFCTNFSLTFFWYLDFVSTLASPLATMDSGIPLLMSLAGQVVLLTLNVTLDVQRFGRTNIWSDFLMRYLLNRCSTTCSIPSLELCNTQSGKGLSSTVMPLVVFPTWPTRRWCPCPTFGLERFLLCSSQVASDPRNFFFFVLSFFAVPLFRGVHFYFSHRLVQICHPTELPDIATTGTLIQNLSTSISTLWPPLGISKTGIWFKTT